MLMQSNSGLFTNISRGSGGLDLAPKTSSFISIAHAFSERHPLVYTYSVATYLYSGHLNSGNVLYLKSYIQKNGKNISSTCIKI